MTTTKKSKGTKTTKTTAKKSDLLKVKTSVKGGMTGNCKRDD